MENSKHVLFSPDQSQKNGHYFLQVVRSEIGLLKHLADSLQSEIASIQFSDEVEGELRCAVGKTRLLVNQKLRQFEELCLKNISHDQSDDFPVTDQDLAGFWDLVFIEVESMHKMFDNIAKLKENS